MMSELTYCAAERPRVESVLREIYREHGYDPDKAQAKKNDPDCRWYIETIVVKKAMRNLDTKARCAIERMLRDLQELSGIQGLGEAAALQIIWKLGVFFCAAEKRRR